MQHLKFIGTNVSVMKSSGSVKSSFCRWSGTEWHWMGHSRLSVLGTGFPLSPIKWRMYSEETRWPRGAFHSASIKSFYFSGFFFFLLTFLTRKKKTYLEFTLQLLFISLVNTDLFKGRFVNFQSAFLGSSAAWFQRRYFICYLQPSSVEQLPLPRHNSRCRHPWLRFLFFHPLA